MQVCSLSKNWKEAQNNKLQSKLNLEAQIYCGKKTTAVFLSLAN